MHVFFHQLFSLYSLCTYVMLCLFNECYIVDLLLPSAYYSSSIILMCVCRDRTAFSHY